MLNDYFTFETLIFVLILLYLSSTLNVGPWVPEYFYIVVLVHVLLPFNNTNIL